jgi:hypothetical protein
MIHYDVPAPKLSKDFTIDDIHKVRLWNYERMKDATIQERLEDTEKRVNSMLKRLNLTNFKTVQF